MMEGMMAVAGKLASAGTVAPCGELLTQAHPSSHRACSRFSDIYHASPVLYGAPMCLFGREDGPEVSPYESRLAAKRGGGGVRLDIRSEHARRCMGTPCLNPRLNDGEAAMRIFRGQTNDDSSARSMSNQLPVSGGPAGVTPACETVTVLTQPDSHGLPTASPCRTCC